MDEKEIIPLAIPLITTWDKNPTQSTFHSPDIDVSCVPITKGTPAAANNAGNNDPSLLFLNLKWLTAREAVVYLRLPSLGALRNLVYRRQIPFTKLGRNLRFDREGLDRFLESSRTKRRIL